MEAELVQREGVPYEAVEAAGVHGVGIKSLPGNLIRLLRGYGQARGILKRFRPEVLFFTGGFVAGPVAMAARSGMERRAQILVYVPDIEPGLALKGLARFSDHIALSTDASRAYFGFKRADALSVTGYPVRPGLRTLGLEEARQILDLGDDLPVLLVMGGSSGARSINRALLGVLPDLLSEMQVVHLSGKLDWSEVEAARDRLPAGLRLRYRPYAYLHTELMGAALTAADLAVSRAGASILGEYPLFGLPAILVPYPYAWRYQQVNAQYLAKQGAAQIIQDADLPSKLLPAVRNLVQDAPKRAAMKQAMSALATPQAAAEIAGLLQDMAGLGHAHG